MPADPFVSGLQQALGALFPELANLPVPKGCLAIDSRRIQVGDVFVALNGSQHKGADFIASAIAKGAALVLLEQVDDARQGLRSDVPLQAESQTLNDQLFWQDSVPVVALESLRARLGQWLAQTSGLDSDALHLIGITGTNGKTSISHYLAQLLEGLGQKTAVIGTVGIGALDALNAATHTTPDLIQLHRVMAALKAEGFNYQAMEVSSHALDQQRTAGVPFQIAVFSNLSRDHLDYHHSMAAYGAAKARLFTDYPLSVAVLNADDAFSSQLQSEIQIHNAAVRIVTYSLSDPAADLYCQHLCANPTGFELSLAGRWGEHRIQLPLLGDFNVSNALAAAAVLLSSGFPVAEVMAHLASIQPVAGRMQRVIPQKEQGPQVVVDYAHTPDALENALGAVRAHIEGRLWCVFGCGGDRDAGKRPLMAAVASRLADHVVLTSDNPRTEAPGQILTQVAAGLARPATLSEPDRQEAIRQSICQAGPMDVVLIAGKGHETYQEINGVRQPFDDVAQAIDALKHRASGKRAL